MNFFYDLDEFLKNKEKIREQLRTETVPDNKKIKKLNSIFLKKENNKKMFLIKNLEKKANMLEEIHNILLELRDNAPKQEMEHIIYLKILLLLLYFNDTTIEGKTLDFSEYEQWAKIFIEFANIRMNELEGIDLENIKIITDAVQTLFLDVFRDETFQNKYELEVIEVKNLPEKFIYETINSKEILSFQVAFTSYKLVNEQYNNLKDNQELVLEGIDLKIKVITDKIEKNNMKLWKIKNIWFYKIWKCRQLKKSNKNWEIKLGEKIAEKDFFLKNLKFFILNH